MNLKSYLVASILFFLSIKSVSAQVVMFNDTGFKNILLENSAININNDDEIQVSEAESFAGKLELNNVTISDLTGLEAFSAMTELNFYSSVATALDVSQNTSLERLDCGNLSDLKLGNNEALSYVITALNNFTHLEVDNSYLDSLICWHNNVPLTVNLSSATSLKYLNLNDNALPNLKVSFLPALETLICHVNSLTELDLSQNPLLEYVECQLNPLESLDLSENINLRYLGCSGTSISSIDLSQNSALETLRLDYTPMTFLDVSNNEQLIWLDCFNASLELLNVKNGNNINFEYFDVRENANLECIQVDDEDYSRLNWMNISSPALYNTICESITTSANELNQALLQYQAYPNPTTNTLNIEFDQAYNEIQVEIYDRVGKMIAFNNFRYQSQIELDLNNYTGLLFFKVRVDGKEIGFKVIKE